MSSVNGDNFTSFFPIWKTQFISFPCLIALDRASSSMLDRSGESRYSCLVPDLRGKAFSLLPLNMMFPVGF